MRRLLSKAVVDGHCDLEAVEFSLRTAVLHAGATLLEQLLTDVGRGRQNKVILCCGQRMESSGVETKRLLTVLGWIRFSRTRLVCSVCKKSHYPGDKILDVEGTTRSPGVRRLMARAGSRGTFKEGAEDLRIYAELVVSPKDVERTAQFIGDDMSVWTTKERMALLKQEPPPQSTGMIPVLYLEYDGTGIPMVPWELEGRKGKQADGTAKTREAKLGCVFTQTTVNTHGYAIRDDDSTSFVGAIETAEDFADRIEAEAIRRGLWQARQVVIIGDGAKWIWGIANSRFPQALQIVDKYHAREHIANLARLVSNGDDRTMRRRRVRWWILLDNGAVERIIAEARILLPSESESAKKITNETGYLEDNKQRMRYQTFRALGLFVGSGVIEAGCKHVVGQRLKRSGMEWTVAGANAIISLRSAIISGRLEDYWEQRVA